MRVVISSCLNLLIIGIIFAQQAPTRPTRPPNVVERPVFAIRVGHSQRLRQFVQVLVAPAWREESFQSLDVRKINLSDTGIPKERPWAKS
jgi:hypothetical protein